MKKAPCPYDINIILDEANSFTQILEICEFVRQKSQDLMDLLQPVMDGFKKGELEITYLEEVGETLGFPLTKNRRKDLDKYVTDLLIKGKRKLTHILNLMEKLEDNAEKIQDEIDKYEMAARIRELGEQLGIPPPRKGATKAEQDEYLTKLQIAMDAELQRAKMLKEPHENQYKIFKPHYDKTRKVN